MTDNTTQTVSISKEATLSVGVESKAKGQSIWDGSKATVTMTTSVQEGESYADAHTRLSRDVDAALAAQLANMAESVGNKDPAVNNTLRHLRAQAGLPAAEDYEEEVPVVRNGNAQATAEGPTYDTSAPPAQTQVPTTTHSPDGSVTHEGNVIANIQTGDEKIGPLTVTVTEVKSLDGQYGKFYAGKLKDHSGTIDWQANDNPGFEEGRTYEISNVWRCEEKNGYKKLNLGKYVKVTPVQTAW